MTKTSNESKRLRSSLRTIALVVMAFVLGRMFASTEHRAVAQFRGPQSQYQTPPPKAFLSGGARSELVLLEISQTAKRIEAQLIKIDKTIQQLEKPLSH